MNYLGFTSPIGLLLFLLPCVICAHTPFGLYRRATLVGLAIEKRLSIVFLLRCRPKCERAEPSKRRRETTTHDGDGAVFAQHVWETHPASATKQSLDTTGIKAIFLFSPIPVYSRLDLIFWTGFGRDFWFYPFFRRWRGFDNFSKTTYEIGG